MKKVKQGNRMTDITDVRSALKFINYADASRADRIKVFAGLCDLESQTLPVAQEWSGMPTLELQRLLEGLTDRRTTIKSVFYMAVQNGWKPATAAKLFDFTADDTYEARFLRPIETNRKLVFVKSEKGTGKTEQLTNLLANSEGRVLLAGHRCVLLRQSAKRLGFSYYEDHSKEELNKQERLAITLDSLYKLDMTAFNEVGVLILDECGQVLRHLMGATVGDKRSATLSILGFLINTAKQVVCLDADLSDVEVSFIKSLCHSDPSYVRIHNTFAYTGRAATKYPTREALLAVAKVKLQAGQSVFYTTTSRKDADVAYAFLNEFATTHRIVTSENSQDSDTQAFVDDINARMPQLLVVSPSLGTGVSIDVPVDNVFVCGVDNPGITFQDLLQQMWRVRNPGMVHTWVQVVNRSKVTTTAQIKQEALDNCNVIIRIADGGVRTVSSHDYESEYLELYAANTAKLNHSTNRTAECFYNAMTESGWSVNEADNTKDTGTKAELKGIRDELKAVEVLATVAAPVLDAGQVKDLLDKPTLTPDERFAVNAYDIRKTYKVDRLTPELVELYDNGRGKRQLEAYEHLFFDPIALATIDRASAKGIVTDTTKFYARNELRKTILKLAFGTDDLTAILNGDITTVTDGKLEDWAKDHKAEISQTLGIGESVSRLRTEVCKQIGVKLEFVKRVGSDKDKQRIYVVAGADVMEDFRQQRLSAEQVYFDSIEDLGF